MADRALLAGYPWLENIRVMWCHLSTLSHSYKSFQHLKPKHLIKCWIWPLYTCSLHWSIKILSYSVIFAVLRYGHPVAEICWRWRRWIITLLIICQLTWVAGILDCQVTLVQYFSDLWVYDKYSWITWKEIHHFLTWFFSRNQMLGYRIIMNYDRFRFQLFLVVLAPRTIAKL